MLDPRPYTYEYRSPRLNNPTYKSSNLYQSLYHLKMPKQNFTNHNLRQNSYKDDLFSHHQKNALKLPCLHNNNPEMDHQRNNPSSRYQKGQTTSTNQVQEVRNASLPNQHTASSNLQQNWSSHNSSYSLSKPLNNPYLLQRKFENSTTKLNEKTSMLRQNQQSNRQKGQINHPSVQAKNKKNQHLDNRNSESKHPKRELYHSENKQYGLNGRKTHIQRSNQTAMGQSLQRRRASMFDQFGVFEKQQRGYNIISCYPKEQKLGNSLRVFPKLTAEDKILQKRGNY